MRAASILSVFLASALLMTFPGTAESASAMVDIEKILIDSNAAHQGREHIQAVRERLEQGYAELAKALSKAPEEQRQKEMQEAAQALTQQLELEKRAVNQVITRMMMEEVRSFRIANKIEMIVPKQVILDADAGIDITNQIIKAMNAKSPVFGKLPVIQVKEPNKQKK